MLFTYCSKDDEQPEQDQNKKPLIAFITPTDNPAVVRGDIVEFSVQVNDPDGLISEVNYSLNDQVIKTLEPPLYDFKIYTEGFKAGAYTIGANVIDNEGASATVSMVLTVAAIAPKIKTLPVIYVGPEAATSGIEIISAATPEILEKGICWGTTTQPTVEHEKILVTAGKIRDPNNPFVSIDNPIIEAVMAPLEKETVYYARAFATNDEGTVYGEEFSFTTKKEYWSDKGTFIDDRNGITYKWVTIGNQTWMAENLKADEGRVYGYRGEYDYTIPDRPPRYGGYDYEKAKTFENYAIYGTLNSYDCPEGWRKPENTELKELMNFCGGSLHAAKHLMETGTEHWIAPNEALNSSLFTALPSGEPYTYWVYADFYNPVGYLGITFENLGSIFRIGGVGGGLTITNNRAYVSDNVNNNDIKTNPQGRSRGAACRCIKDN